MWWNSGTVMVEQCGGKENSHGGTVMVEQWNTNSGTMWWNSGTLIVEQCGGTEEQ